MAARPAGRAVRRRCGAPRRARCHIRRRQTGSRRGRLGRRDRDRAVGAVLRVRRPPRVGGELPRRDRLAGLSRTAQCGIHSPGRGFCRLVGAHADTACLVQTAFFAYAARLAEQIAAQLGRTEDEQRWRELYEQVRAAYRRKFVRGGGRVVSGTRTAYVLSLQFGLREPDEEPRAAAHLVDEIASRNWHLSTGFLGAPYLLPVLERYGYEDVAFRLLMQDSYPSWLYPVVYGRRRRCGSGGTPGVTRADSRTPG